MKGRRLISRRVRHIEVEPFEIDPIPDDGILVRNEFTAVSVGTELWNWLHGSEPGRAPRFPRTTGYCSAGTVLETGKDVTGVRPGDRVAGQGSHASHAILRKMCHKLPEGVSLKAGSLLTMAAIAMHGIRTARLQLGESVAVVGLGLVGQFAVSLARLAGGVPVIGLDLNADRLARAGVRGADACINPSSVPDVTEAVRALCPEDGAQCVIEATGLPAVYPMAVKLACFAGRMVSLGSPRGTVEFDFLADVHLREVSILGAIHPRTPEQPHPYFPWTKDRERTLLLRLMGEGRLGAEDLVTHVANPEECRNVYTMLVDRPGEALGVVFDWRA